MDRDAKVATLSRASWLALILPTLLYWSWESRAEGNIRVDLLAIFPVLFAIYTRALWRNYRFWVLPAASIRLTPILG